MDNPVFFSIADLVKALTIQDKLESEANAKKVLKIQLFQLNHILEAQAGLPCYYQAVKIFNNTVH